MYSVKYKTVSGKRKYYLAQDKHPVPETYISDQVRVCLEALNKLADRHVQSAPAPGLDKPLPVLVPREDPAFKPC